MRREQGVGRILQIESAAVLALILAVYWQRDASWILFAVLFMAPDLSAIGYLVNPRVGALGYNLGHTALFPALLATLGLVIGTPLLVTIALIWGSHITFDRAFGYGFKDALVFPVGTTAERPAQGARADVGVSIVGR